MNQLSAGLPASGHADEGRAGLAGGKLHTSRGLGSVPPFEAGISEPLIPLISLEPLGVSLPPKDDMGRAFEVERSLLAKYEELFVEPVSHLEDLRLGREVGPGSEVL